MARKPRKQLALELSAALLGTLPVALFTALALARLAPLSDQARAVVGLYAPLPLYAVLACLAARMRWKTAWFACATTTVALEAVLRIV